MPPPDMMVGMSDRDAFGVTPQGRAPSALQVVRSRAFPNGSLQLEYDVAGEPTFRDMA